MEVYRIPAVFEISVLILEGIAAAAGAEGNIYPVLSHQVGKRIHVGHIVAKAAVLVFYCGENDRAAVFVQEGNEFGQKDIIISFDRAHVGGIGGAQAHHAVAQQP